MNTDELKIEPFDFRHSTRGQYEAATVFFTRMQAERLPDDPPDTLEDKITGWQNIPDFVHIEAWGIWRMADGSVVGAGNFNHLLTGQNQHAAEYAIEVLPEFRRQGLGTRLLQEVANAAQRANRRLLLTNTDDHVPAGALCMQRIGARKGMENQTNQLRISELNRDLVQQWLAEGKANEPEFALGFWDGAYPEADIPQVLRLFDVMNTMPRDNLELEDTHFTEEHVRQMEESRKARGTTHWTFYVRDEASGNLVGFTDVYWHPSKPTILNQGNTGVFPEYRNRGLGRWLKAAMLDKVLREKPQVEFVRTSNAASNAPMLKINYDLGFKPYISQVIWQVETDRIFEYLRQRKISAIPRN